MKIAVLVASRNRPDLVESMAQSLKASMTLPYDLFVVECGTDRDKLSASSTLWYADPDFRGKCWGHALALDAAKLTGKYDYYFVLMNDVVFPAGVDAARILVEQMEREPRLALLSPTNVDGGYAGAARKGTHGWRAVTTCDYLGFMMRASAVEDVGFLNPAFKYCWGAIHELAYKLYSRGWFLAYSDEVSYKHLGGSTYGQKDTKTISREDYQQRAKRFAFDYFRRTYGDNWDEQFWAATRAQRIETNTFTEHKKLWSTAFSAAELRELGVGSKRAEVTFESRMTPDAESGAVRLHIGCGSDKRNGWINIDANASLAPDVVTEAHVLTMFEDQSADVIEANHLFEHLPLHQAHAALREWARVLKPGAELFLELPDFEACVRSLGRYKDEKGFDLGMIGIFGWPPLVEKEGLTQVHKWGWTRATLIEALRLAGFERTEFGPITQTWRAAAKAGTLLRLRAVRGGQRARVESAPTFTLRTESAFRVFAWPNWREPSEVEFLLNAFGRHLVRRTDACLCLRRDPASDPSVEEVDALLRAAHARTLGNDAPLEVLVVDDALSASDWTKLRDEIACAVALRSSASGARAVAYAVLGKKVVHSIEELSRSIGGATQAPATQTYSREVLDSVDWATVSRIKDLHPWYYPVVLGNLKVTPGVGSHVSSTALEHSTACRTTLLVDEVARRVDLRGKSVLELASNCGYWSSHYARRGATRVVGLEGRDTFLEQARLYWSVNKFLPEGSYEFVKGNIADPRAWDRLRELGPFDVVLCAGILYHVANYREVLSWAAELARETLIVDTRVDDAEEALIREPGELYFNAIEETRVKVVPNRARLLRAVREAGLEPMVLPVGFGAGPGVDDVDNYAAGRRVTLLAQRVGAPIVPHEEHSRRDPSAA